MTSICDLRPIHPLDRYNQELIDQVHPEAWQSPTPQPLYDLVVIGAGPAGLVVAAGLGAKVALVERHLMGGDCLNVGCVPSKCLLSSARVVSLLKRSSPLGIEVSAYQADFPAVMERLRRIRAELSHHDSAQRFQEELGVDVFLGSGAFVGDDRIQVGEHGLRFKKAVIATGARPRIPAIPGLDTVTYHTNETIFSLTTCPPVLAVIGAGPIGCELAQAFQNLGSQVVLFHRHDRILNREEPEAADLLQRRLAAEGVHLILSAEIEQITKDPGQKTIVYQYQGERHRVTVDEILVGAGRAPNVEGLNLEGVGIAYDRQRGVHVNDFLQTTNPRIYAAGDICLDWQFTHVADAAARMVIKNTLFSPWGLGRYRFSQLVLPRCTYTQPEIAQVGVSASEAAQQGIPVDQFKIPLERSDRAVAAGETEGFVQIQVQKGTDKIVGATIVADHAGDLINEITLAMVHKIGLGGISSVIHPYPTQGEIIRKAADAYRKTLLTPRSLALLKFILRLS
jgi:pyruvate/2-oxoglutarate dehydrogenase complex dihydrolipoamide dehydrogenase (E3) component